MTQPTCCSSAQAEPETGVDRVRRRLESLPTVPTALVVLALVVVGLLVGGAVGGVLLAVAVLGLAGMLALEWTRMTAPERALRAALICLIAAVAIIRVVPR